MKTILTFPDGSAIDGRFIHGITWNKSTSGSYASKATIRVHGSRSESMFDRGEQLEQLHYIPMESDEEAKTACEALVRAWSGNVFAPFTAPAGTYTREPEAVVSAETPASSHGAGPPFEGVALHSPDAAPSDEHADAMAAETTQATEADGAADAP